MIYFNVVNTEQLETDTETWDSRPRPRLKNETETETQGFKTETLNWNMCLETSRLSRPRLESRFDIYISDI